MLVLSRGENDRIVFPSLGISVEVLKMKGSKVAIGIDAPQHIRVVRHELLQASDAYPDQSVDAEVNQMRQHELRNEINRATLKLQIAAKLFENGETSEGLAAMAKGIAELCALGTDVATQENQVSETAAPYLCDGESTVFAKSNAPNGGKVLLVDDDDNERTLMASYLNRCGLHVDQASDGLKAIYALSSNIQPDVVLLDMNMPNLNGRETIKQIRACSPRPNVPVFAVTAEPIETSGVSIDENGVTGWFQKPVQIDQIVSAIQQCVPAAAPEGCQVV
ncbi:response regulator [Stieleria marina]|uniref:Translational regulator CsrA n=1 Tax=Stieleria marina TaxID=1930275 RepID=A0A517NZ05_9BACT|nr:Sporulation initiation phosphotransferase F [Planctomycetes bacterium K23_9]